MTRNPIRLLAYSSAIALATCFYGQAHAQIETVSATLITSSAIDTVKVTDMDFGEWLIQFAAATTPSITLTSDGTAATSATGTVGASTLVEITDSANEGQITVEVPAPTVMSMTRAAVTNFVDTNISLSTITYQTATEAATTFGVGNGNAVNVTVLAGATPEDVNFGGIVTITGTPADATHTASFVVTLAY